MRRILRLLLVLPAGLAGATGCGGGSEVRAAQPAASPAFVPAPEPAAAPIPEPAGARAPRRSARRYESARVTRRVMLRATPGGRVVGRVGTRTEFGTRTVLGVVRRRGGWLQVTTPQRPNGRHAWIPASRARLSASGYAIHVDRSARRLTLRHGRRVVRRIPVAVGRPGSPTPLGRFSVTDKLRPRRADSPYGCCILALSGRQTKLVPGWPGGDRLAIHATPQLESVGRAASLGCLRGHPRDLEALMRRVPLGTPVFVRP
jgi:lipoprotein-anchoring transpeptidase ErfK/SrfK